MDSYRIKVKIGDHEFEAEGDPETVRSQFDAFKELISSIPLQKDTTPIPQTQQVFLPQQVTPDQESASYDKIFKIENRVISLTALPGNVLDATLLTMFGQKQFRNNDSITGAEVKDGLEQAGYRVDRVDRLIDKLTADGLIIKIGAGKGSRYRLTNIGMTRAQLLAKDVLATLP
jgi:hypothetical protein